MKIVFAVQMLFYLRLSGKSLSYPSKRRRKLSKFFDYVLSCVNKSTCAETFRRDCRQRLLRHRDGKEGLKLMAKERGLKCCGGKICAHSITQRPIKSLI